MVQSDSKKSLKDKLIDAALSLAAERCWNDVSLEQIIEAAEVDFLEAFEYFDEKTDVMAAYERRVDAQIIADMSDGDESLSEREKLFDLLMERFDVLNEDREALLSILNSFKGEPKQAVVGLPHLAQSMSRMLDAVGIEAQGICGASKVTGLVGVYLYALRVWKNDDSPDMAKTMAALDKALDYAELTANSFANGGVLSNLSDLCKNFMQKRNES